MLANNYARNMTITAAGSPVGVTSNSGGIHGETSSQFNDPAWWTEEGRWNTDPPAFAWDFVDVWEWDSAVNLPVLK